MVGNKNARPVNLYLPGIRLPVGGVVSILHRVTGLLLVLSLPLALYALDQSLTGPEGFARVIQACQTPPARGALFLLVWAISHHLLAGVRHLLLDIDIGIARDASRRGAWLVLAGVAAVLVVAGWGLFG